MSKLCKYCKLIVYSDYNDYHEFCAIQDQIEGEIKQNYPEYRGKYSRLVQDFSTSQDKNKRGLAQKLSKFTIFSPVDLDQIGKDLE